MSRIDRNDHLGNEGRDILSRPAEQGEDERDYLIEPPKPDPICLYGLVGDIGRAAAEGTEANPFAAAAGALVRLSAAVGPAHYLQIGNVFHRSNLYGCHVGRSNDAGKGEAFGLFKRIAGALGEGLGLTHDGGLSSSEGLAYLVRDAVEGEDGDPGVDDKRLFVHEEELDVLLARMRFSNNAISGDLRKVYDGGSIKPATKNSRTFATHPHIALWANITPSELRSSMSAKELSNGFANRFMLLFAERTSVVAIPHGRSEAEVAQFAQRVQEAVEFAVAGYPYQTRKTPMRLSPAAERLYKEMYPKLTKRSGSELIDGLLARRRVIVMRISMLLALLDMTVEISEEHMAVALAWARFHGDSVRFIFSGDMAQRERAEATRTAADKILEQLTAQSGEWMSRSELREEVFSNRITKAEMDAAIQTLLTDRRVERREVPRQDGPGRKRTEYRAASFARIAPFADLRASQQKEQAASFARLGAESDPPKSANSAKRADGESAAKARKSSNVAKSANSAGVYRGNGLDGGAGYVEVEV